MTLDPGRARAGPPNPGGEEALIQAASSVTSDQIRTALLNAQEPGGLSVVSSTTFTRGRPHLPFLQQPSQIFGLLLGKTSCSCTMTSARCARRQVSPMCSASPSARAHVGHPGRIGHHHRPLRMLLAEMAERCRVSSRFSRRPPQPRCSPSAPRPRHRSPSGGTSACSSPTRRKSLRATPRRTSPRRVLREPGRSGARPRALPRGGPLQPRRPHGAQQPRRPPRRQGRRAEAEPLFRAAIAADPGSGVAHANLARQLARRGFAAEASGTSARPCDSTHGTRRPTSSSRSSSSPKGGTRRPPRRSPGPSGSTVSASRASPPTPTRTSISARSRRGRGRRRRRRRISPRPRASSRVGRGAPQPRRRDGTDRAPP